MPAYLYQRVEKQGGEKAYEQIRKVSLGGHNAVFNLWEKKGKPLNKGWHISKEELLEDTAGKDANMKDYVVILDASPSMKTEVFLAEVFDIYVYTFGEEKTVTPWWSVLMLRVKILLRKYEISEKEKIQMTIEPAMPQEPRQELHTFLYLHGSERSWNWGRLGQMNGAWIEPNARDYFKGFFCKD